MRLAIVAALAVAHVNASPASAQAVLLSDRAIKAMPTTYRDPLCDLKGSHWKTTAAITHLKTALEATDTAKRHRELKKSTANQLEAIRKNKQFKSSTAWYTLARLYLYQGDLLGADSALARAHAISPKCAGTFDGLRYQVWLPLITAASDFAKSGANDSALALFRQAAAINPRNPQAALNAGVILANAGETDSAIAYFRTAARVAERARPNEIRDQATLNLGLMLQRAERHPEAIAALERYLGWHSKDIEAKRALSVSYHATGAREKAADLDADLLAAAGASNSAAVGGASADPGDAMRIGLTYYNEKKWAEAAKAFELAVAAAPYSREALYALANTYLASIDGPRLVRAAKRLVAIEPMSADALALLGTGYRRTRREGLALETAERLFSLPIDVAIQPLAALADTGALVTGTATGRPAQTPRGKPVPPKPTTLMFEFLDASGRVVARGVAEIPALKPSQTAPIAVTAKGKGIVGWRYTVQD